MSEASAFELAIRLEERVKNLDTRIKSLEASQISKDKIVYIDQTLDSFASIASGFKILKAQTVLFAVIASTLLGWVIPAIIKSFVSGWFQ